MAYKVFTNGSVLNASEINENLMQQSVATFSNSAARTAAITTPVEGQLSYLIDVNLYEHWTDSEWVSPFGLTLLRSQTVGTAVGSVTVSNVFSGQYNNYRIVYSGGVGSAIGDGINLRFNNSTGSTYGHAVQFITMGALSTGNGGFNSASGILTGLTGSNSTSVVLDVLNPNQAVETTVTIASHELSTSAANSYTVIGTGIDSNSASQTGFSFSTSPGTLTGGIIYVYGYRKAV